MKFVIKYSLYNSDNKEIKSGEYVASKSLANNYNLEQEKLGISIKFESYLKKKYGKEFGRLVIHSVGKKPVDFGNQFDPNDIMDFFGFNK